MFGGHPAKIMDEVGRLFVIPPSDGFNLGTTGSSATWFVATGFVAAMRQHERDRAVDQNFHGDLQCVEAWLGQDPVGTHNGCARRHILRDHGVCPNRGAAAHGDPAQDFCPGPDVNPVFNVGRGG